MKAWQVAYCLFVGPFAIIGMAWVTWSIIVFMWYHTGAITDADIHSMIPVAVETIFSGFAMGGLMTVLTWDEGRPK